MLQPSNSVLVTGATGFIGSHLCSRLKAQDCPVVALGRSARDGPWDRFIECDLANDAIPVQSLEGISTIYHLAGKAHDFSGKSDDTAYASILVEGTRKLVEAARKAGIETFILMSSVKAMGEGNPSAEPLVALDESQPPSPESPYGMAKREAEVTVLGGGFRHAVILRPVMVFGNDGKGNLIRMRNAVRRRRFPPFPENGNKRSMIHVGDVVEFTLQAAARKEARGGTYILAHAEPVSTRELYNAVRLSLGKGKARWSIPLWVLRLLAVSGSILGKILDRRLLFDNETYGKLTGSAWYSPDAAMEDLDYTARQSVVHWLQSGMKD